MDNAMHFDGCNFDMPRVLGRISCYADILKSCTSNCCKDILRAEEIPFIPNMDLNNMTITHKSNPQV